jgi:hypothetical protein
MTKRGMVLNSVLNSLHLLLNSSELRSELLGGLASVGVQKKHKVQKLGTHLKKESNIKKEREGQETRHFGISFLIENSSMQYIPNGGGRAYR